MHNMHAIQEWCRIIRIDGVSVLFYQDFDSDDDHYQIHAMVKTDGAVMDTKVRKDSEFSLGQFNSYASEPIARTVIDQAKRLGFEPATSPYSANIAQLLKNYRASIGGALCALEGDDHAEAARVEALLADFYGEPPHVH